jgi:hypothetical protein
VVNTYIDEKGRTWQRFGIQYTHPLDDMQFIIDLWALDYADAEERLVYLKETGTLGGAFIKYGCDE